MYLNKAFVIGNLTRDPEVRSLPSGIQVCSFSVATNSRFKDKSGAWQDKAEYHNIVVFGRQAETSGQYLKKGSNVLVEGRMQTRSWDGQDGKKNYRTEIVADRVQFGNRPAGGAAPSGSAPASPKGVPKSKAGASGGEEMPPLDTIQYPEEEANTEDIPF